jgi:UDP-N-acetylmuramate dehydrogenase
VGGPAEALLIVETGSELVEAVSRLAEQAVPFMVLGNGSNVLVSDAGVDGVVVLNHAHHIQFDEQSDPITVWAESGASLGLVARKAAARGLSGLEWAAGIPGTVGGAVVGNAGAHGGDIAGSLVLAEILHLIELDGQPGSSVLREEWKVEKLAYAYRTSILKREPGMVVVAAIFRLERNNPETVLATMENYNDQRKQSQPPGASMGSMFKNPPGDFAGRLIEACGLKGTRIGDAEISNQHANFFINRGQATATDIYNLIQLARTKVAEKFNLNLDLEIELIGHW